MATDWNPVRDNFRSVNARSHALGTRHELGLPYQVVAASDDCRIDGSAKSGVSDGWCASTTLGICLGWLALIRFFRTFGDAISHSAAHWIFGWNVERGYRTGDFGPFYAYAFVVSILGFLLAELSSTRI